MRRLRHQLRALAAAVLCALALVSAAGAAHDQVHHDGALGITAHDASAHAFGPRLDEAGHALHCVLCHWTRHVRPRQDAQLVPAPTAIGSLPIGAATAAVVRDATGIQPPLRAPPVPASHV